MNNNIFFGTIKNFGNEAIADMPYEAISLKNSLNKAKRWGFDLEVELLNEGGDVKITILDPKKGKEELEQLCSYICHREETDKTGEKFSLTEITNIREEL